jgi:hypothetical protein
MEANPTVARRRLAVYFKRLREQRGVGLDELASVLDVDPSFASRLDTGARGFRAQDIGPLCDLYDIDREERERLLAIVAESRRRAWWQKIDLDDSLRTLIGMEQAALAIREFAASAVPGLLQLREYAEAVSEAVGTPVPPRQHPPAIEARMRRQEILGREHPPALWAIIDEAVLARGAGDRFVMRKQLTHLHDVSLRPAVRLQVVGFERGFYPAWGQHFQLLEMGDELPDVLYQENYMNLADTADAVAVEGALRLWNNLDRLALDPDESRKRVSHYIEQLD